MPTVASLTVDWSAHFAHVLISYYDRYGLPLLGVKMLLVLYGVDSGSGFLARHRRRIKQSS